MPSISIWVGEVDGAFAALGKREITFQENADALLEVSKKFGKWYDVPVKLWTYNLQTEVANLSFIRDEEGKLVYKEELEARHRTEKAIATWPDWEWKSLGDCPAVLANTLIKEVFVACYPNFAQIPDFLSALKTSVPPSEG